MLRKDSPAFIARFDGIDALRGLAMVWMTAFHFCFDLNQFGYIRQDFYRDPFWTWQRTLILSLFLFCAGVGQAIAVAQGQSWPRFWRRWAQVLGCALLVTAGSWLMYPQSFIYFGVLHGIALMLIIARLTTRWGGWLWGLGAVAIAIKYIATYAIETGATPLSIDIFNSPQLNWLGVITRKPITEDYVPLLPWLGVMWWGVATGTWLSSQGGGRLSWRLPTIVKPLATIGRWSLSYYMLHQPVMIGALMAVGWLAK
ncbi:MAG: heparan-alpha-glucosaminide N-acetyltransferase [Rhodoferax sp.]|nr:heparan-alpha-glucosaminide N-acetyltransferase [Rhodoferax sp.]